MWVCVCVSLCVREAFHRWEGRILSSHNNLPLVCARCISGFSFCPFSLLPTDRSVFLVSGAFDDTARELGDLWNNYRDAGAPRCVRLYLISLYFIIVQSGAVCWDIDWDIELENWWNILRDESCMSELIPLNERLHRSFAVIIECWLKMVFIDRRLSFIDFFSNA